MIRWNRSRDITPAHENETALALLAHFDVFAAGRVHLLGCLIDDQVGLHVPTDDFIISSAARKFMKSGDRGFALSWALRIVGTS
jgi:hypothetical protein